ncbi:hypothetical protein Tsubulata_002062 [Turnera subulata]|uniref:Uncharacterized protein n=1 Tax=Turnera subulata TaxID=218843 RepID=A0A9Q0JG19_9ROSI|nr:hypothetical protein Tsubulata_002062 [Turnera subulata]
MPPLHHSLPLLSPPFLSPPSRSSFLFPRPTTLLPFYLLPKPHRNPLPVFISRCIPPKPTEQQILQFVADSNEASLPCVRTYENDLSRLTLVGSVAAPQAITAAASDGGRAANDHANSGAATMVLETVFPGPPDENSTVSTRLFLPTKKVKERASKLEKTLSAKSFSGTSPENVLAVMFRQVVMERLWSFELMLFKPGTERDMNDLENAREVPPSFVLSSSDENVISVIAEVVCTAALQSTEKHFLEESLGIGSAGFFGWFRKEQRIVSNDRSVVLVRVIEDEMFENAKTLLENFYLSKESLKGGGRMKRRHKWWTLSTQSKLETIGGPEFCAWMSEYLPVYKLQIDATKVKDVKFEGWTKSTENRWEVLLTHSQMVGLAEILDIYYEDAYSLPNKELSCGVVSNFTNLSNKKNNSSLMNILSVSLATGMFLIAVAAFSNFGFPQLWKRQSFVRKHQSLPASETQIAVNESFDAEKLEEFCVSIIKKIKDTFGWSGDVKTEADMGAWIGDIPIYLRTGETDFNSEKNAFGSTPLQKNDADIKSSAQDIATYQVVLSADGKVVGFQPTSLVGVNHWASNPLAKELYGGRKLSPGFVEPGLNIRLPTKVAVIELLLSVNSDAIFALARPVR